MNRQNLEMLPDAALQPDLIDTPPDHDPFSVDQTTIQGDPDTQTSNTEASTPQTTQANQSGNNQAPILTTEQVLEAKTLARRKLKTHKVDRLRQNDLDRNEQLLFLLKQGRMNEDGTVF